MNDRQDRDDLLAGLGRFSEPALYILISLAEGSKHGYAMTQDIAAMSGQTLGPGTLYGAIARLEARQWIEALPAEDRRRPYRLTAAGRRVLRHRLDSLRAVARVGETRLAGSESG
jgi:DNA-binding PadR family transcriptional regulator